MDSTLTSKGQATIPKEVRDTLGIEAGDKVRFFVMPDGRVFLRKVIPASALRGILHRPGQRPMSLAEMDGGIAAYVREKDRRSRSDAKAAPRRRKK